MNGRSLLLVTLAGLLLAGTCAVCRADFLEDCRTLTANPHRLAGTTEGKEAVDYITTRLREIGMDGMIIQPFRTTQTLTRKCEAVIEGSGKTLSLSPVRPNGIIPPVTAPGGLSGTLVHVGDAQASEFAEKSVKDAIVVVDYNSAEGWMRAFRLGAKGVIFVRNGPAEARHSHYVESNLNLPRFYYEGPASDFPEGKTVTLFSEVTWEAGTGYNVIGFLKGTDPVFSQEKEEILILAANLDSFGEIPDLAPGARGAANCAGLLKLAEHLQRNRPKRHSLFVFYDNQARGHQGSSTFYRALEDDKDDDKIEKRQEYLDAEIAFMDKLQALLTSSSPLTQEAETSIRRNLTKRLSDKAAEEAFALNDRLYKLRREKETTLREAGDRELTAAETARIAEIDADVDEMTPVKDDWNELRRILGRLLKPRMAGEKTEEADAAKEKTFFTVIEQIGTPRANERAEFVRKHFLNVLARVRTDVDKRVAELDVEEIALKADTELKTLLKDMWICLHASMLLGDGTGRWGLVIGGESALHSSQDNPGLYGKIQAVFLKAYEGIGGKEDNPLLFLPESADQRLPQTRVIWGAPFLIHSGEVAGLFGIYNLALGTVQEGLVREGTPDDTLANLKLARIEKQVDDIAIILGGTDDAAADVRERTVCSQDGLSLRRGIVAGKEYITSGFKDEGVVGPMVMGVLPGSAIPNTPMPGATIQFNLRASYSLAYVPVKPFGFDNFQVLRTTQNGSYFLGPVSGGWIWNQRGGFAAVFDQRGVVEQVSDQNSYRSVRWRLNVFRCRSGMAVLPPQLRTDKLPGEEVTVMGSRTNANLDAKKSYTETTDGVVTWYCEDRERGVKLFSLRQLVGLNNGGETFDAEFTPEDPTGDGFSMEGVPPTIDVPARSSADLWRLNESRLAILRTKGIVDSSLAELHGRSEDILLLAGQETSPLRRESLTTSSFWASQPVYRKVRGMLDDLVFAVLILLGLSVPFAFAVERVVIGAVTIYRQISWFLVFFAITFTILYFSHPAFAIANTPIIIFLGFAIVVMSVLVIFIIMRKFEYELKALQGMTATVHAADVSSVSTFMAAMQMGISTMRRRPMRTALTAITIILLTFTILCFASFGTQSGIVTLFVAPNPAYAGVFVHNVNWNPLSHDLGDVIKGRWGDRVTLCKRLWISPKTQDNPGLLVSREDGSSPVTIKGILGVEDKEFRQREDMRALFGAIDDETVLITSAVARALEVETGDAVILKGRRLKVGKLLDAVRVSAAKDMDTSSILPADFTEASSMQQNAQAQEDAELMTQRNWASLPVDSVAVVSADTARGLGASLYGILLYTEDNTEAISLASDLGRMLPFPVAATRENGVYRHLLGTVLKASGARDLFFPILLGGLVIFGTMLGSVADRQKEIYTFSALGLAPKHVATLFFAESMVYSLLGGLGGYLLAQGTLKLLGVASTYGLVRVPEMNMSSTNTIVTILIVMATVLVSAIYPAIKASKSANPGLMRMWRPPEPQGDVLDLVFPFTVSAYDITGVVSFLKEHFSNHTDTGLGRFMTNSVQLVKESDGNLGLDASLALAPFDLGVSQTFALRSAPSEIPGIDEVKVVLKRLSGQPKDWRRLNKVFLDDLRQQFLIWRSIPHETMELYRERTLTALGENGEDTPSEDA